MSETELNRCPLCGRLPKITRRNHISMVRCVMTGPTKGHDIKVSACIQPLAEAGWNKLTAAAVEPMRPKGETT
jgi:hypothetical protein